MHFKDRGRQERAPRQGEHFMAAATAAPAATAGLDHHVEEAKDARVGGHAEVVDEEGVCCHRRDNIEENVGGGRGRICSSSTAYRPVRVKLINLSFSVVAPLLPGFVVHQHHHHCGWRLRGKHPLLESLTCARYIPRIKTAQPRQQGKDDVQRQAPRRHMIIRSIGRSIGSTADRVVVGSTFWSTVRSFAATDLADIGQAAVRGRRGGGGGEGGGGGRG